FQGVPMSAHYAATKAYVQSLAEGLHLELASHGVDVLAVAPGPVASGFAEQADMQMGATVTPEAVAKGTLNALGKKITVRPGWLSLALESALALLPRWARARIMGQVMSGMTAHQNSS
ncbi:MAG: SDR family NAD(P)-dependent oxidoreductase, partial [Chloroflexota bacterium]